MADESSTKITFRLEVEGDRLEVRAEAPAGEGKAESALPASELLSEIAASDPAHLPSGVQEKAGRALYSTLAVGDVQDLLFDTLQDASERRQAVQFEMRFDADQVALTSYPWELLCNPRGQFLIRDGLVDLTRYITYPQNPPRFEANLQDLPLLRIVSKPAQLPPITAAQLTVDNIVNLAPPTFDEFSKRLLLERMTLWALQFDGHGALVTKCANCETLNDVDNLACTNCRQSLADSPQIGALAFEDVGGVKWIPTDQFGSLLYNANVPMAVLLACESALTGNKLVFSGVAPGLLLAGVPAVIGMQYAVSDTFANSFANSFYALIETGRPLLEALRLARRMNIMEAWYSPVLYLRYRRSAAEEAALKPISQARTVDTAVPREVQVAQDFLARLWIRRPETKPLSEIEMRRELGLPEMAPVDMRAAGVEVKLKPEEDRKLRRGEVEVMLRSSGCDIFPASIKLFVDEDLDAPPAIFTCRAKVAGNISLVFTVSQDGVQIHSVVHPITAVEREAGGALVMASAVVPVAGVPGVIDIPKMAEPPASRGSGPEAIPSSDEPLGMGASADFELEEAAAEVPSPDETVEHIHIDDETRPHSAVPPIQKAEPPPGGTRGVVFPPPPPAADMPLPREVPISDPNATMVEAPPISRDQDQWPQPEQPRAQIPRVQPVESARPPAPKGRFPMRTLVSAMTVGVVVLFAGVLVGGVLLGPMIGLSFPGGFNQATSTPTSAPTVEPTEEATGEQPTATFTPIPGATQPPPDAGSGETIDPRGHRIVEIPPGSFLMGEDDSENARPRHPINITEPFWIDQYEVTNAQYAACVEAGVCEHQANPDDEAIFLFSPDFPDLPVTYVTWEMAAVYCGEWRGGWLPTEAQWEYAARGPDARTYPWGEDFPSCEFTNSAGCQGVPTRVGSVPGDESPFGIRDMAGNVSEWVADWYDIEYYFYGPTNDPLGPEGPRDARIFRGGSYLDKDPVLFTTWFRHDAPEDANAPLLGFRCVSHP